MQSRKEVAVTMPASADPTAAKVEPKSSVEARQAQLAAAVATLRRRAAIGTDRALLLAGAVLIPLGVVVILIGWFGAAHDYHLYSQMSYLISGGILGLGLIVAGGFCYFGYWLTRQVVEARAQAERLADGLARIERLLAAGGEVGRGPARLDVAEERVTRRASAPSGGGVPGVPSPNGMLVATITGTMLHRPDCQVVAGKRKSELRAVSADDPKFKPCKICDPLETPVA
jgi:hypothetical protein